MNARPARTVQGVSVPAFFYGTAWKEERTEPFTRAALRSGFRAIDTANQRRHYHEAGVGAALTAELGSGALTRADVFLQTKFTHRAGQDHRLPYDPAAPLAEQVRQSFESSLEHLGTDYIDSYVLHGPSLRFGIADEDWSAWRAMEELRRAGKTRLIGLSNVSLEQLAAFTESATVPPAFVQNRCYAATGWDAEVRAYCRGHGILYQGFSLLTANPRVLASEVVARASRRTGRSPAQVVFRFTLDAGMVPLTGTTSEVHMKEDLASLDFELEEDESSGIERAGVR